MPPQSPSPERRIWRWYRSMHPLTQVTLGCFTLLFALLLCSFGAAILPALSQGFSQGLQRSYVAPGTARATPDVTSIVVRNHAQIGGTVNDFITQYGAPTQTTSTSSMFTSGNVHITVYAIGAIVDQIAVTGPDAWTAHDTLSFCQQFLPDDAHESSHTPTFITYTSSIGTLTVQVQPPTCSVLSNLS